MSTPTILEQAAIPSSIECEVTQFGGARDQIPDGFTVGEHTCPKCEHVTPGKFAKYTYGPWRARLELPGGQCVQIPAPEFDLEKGEALMESMAAGTRFRVKVTLEEVTE